MIIVPVDSHDEIFGRAAREADHAARRCDLLLVRVQRNGLKIECVEVKSRKAAAVPMQLADDIVDQLEETKRLLISRFFATDPPRIDAPLQRARLAGMLHYYADRAVVNGTLSAEKIDEVHRSIDRHLEANTVAEISMRGFVISLAGAAGFPAEHRSVPIAVLTAADLGRAGFSTKFDEYRLDNAEPANPDDVDAPPDPSPSHVEETPGGKSVGIPKNGTDAPHSGAEVQDDATRSVRVGPEPDAPSVSASEPQPKSPADDVRSSEGGGAVTNVSVTLGTDTHGGDVVWSISTKGSPHGFLLGIPGQGKSVTTRRIVRTFSNSGLPSLLFDFHGDMAASPPGGAQV